MLIQLFQLLTAPTLLFIFLWSIATARPDSHTEKCLINTKVLTRVKRLRPKELYMIILALMKALLVMTRLISQTLVACSSAFLVSLSSPLAMVANAAAARLDLGFVLPTKP